MRNILIIILIAISLTGCNAEGFVFAEGQHTNYEEYVHYQKCFFQEDMTIKWWGYEVEAKAGDTINLVDANMHWYEYRNDVISGKLVIDTGLTDSIIRDSSHYEFKQFYTADSIYVRVYHADVCTVSVNRW